MTNTQKLREALSQIEDALHDAYQNAGQECCGHGQGGECCGNPEPVWDAADQKITGVLRPIQRMLSDAVYQVDAQAAEIAWARGQIERWKKVAESAEDRAQAAADEIERLRGSLTAIERWEVPMVESRGEAVSMSVAYGSNGVRDYFRGVARAALSGESK